MDGFMDIFSLLLAGYGVYFLYQWFQIKIQKKQLDLKNFLPMDMTMDKCDDVAGFIAFIAPWLLVMGASLVIYALASYRFGDSSWFLAVVIGYFAALIATYSFVTRQAKKRFWSDLMNGKKR